MFLEEAPLRIFQPAFRSHSQALLKGFKSYDFVCFEHNVKEENFRLHCISTTKTHVKELLVEITNKLCFKSENI